MAVELRAPCEEGDEERRAKRGRETTQRHNSGRRLAWSIVDKEDGGNGITWHEISEDESGDLQN